MKWVSLTCRTIGAEHQASRSGERRTARLRDPVGATRPIKSFRGNAVGAGRQIAFQGRQQKRIRTGRRRRHRGCPPRKTGWASAASRNGRDSLPAQPPPRPTPGRLTRSAPSRSDGDTYNLRSRFCHGETDGGGPRQAGQLLFADTDLNRPRRGAVGCSNPAAKAFVRGDNGLDLHGGAFRVVQVHRADEIGRRRIGFQMQDFRRHARCATPDEWTRELGSFLGRCRSCGG